MSEPFPRGNVGMSVPHVFAEFLHRIRAGEEQAARELVARYEQVVRREIRARLRDPRLQRLFDSADFCQSVFASFFVRAAAGQYDLDNPSQLVSLLLGMARRKLAFCVRQQRAQRRDNRRLQEGDRPLEQVADQQASPSELVGRQELVALVRQHLSKEENQIAQLRGQGCSWSEVAAQLGGTPEARRVQLARALDRVTRALRLHEEDLE
jgi:RNA polymerase sigma-70 factor (ECF subfamily)